jgi:hypothetical protein
MSCAENAIRHNMMCCAGMVLHNQEKMLQTDVPLPRPKKTFDSSKFLRDASMHRKEVHQLPRVEHKGFSRSLRPEEEEGEGSKEDWHSTLPPPAGSASGKTECNWDGSSGRKRGIGSRLYAAFSRKGSQLAGKLRMPGQQQQRGAIRRDQFFQFSSESNVKCPAAGGTHDRCMHQGNVGSRGCT